MDQCNQILLKRPKELSNLITFRYINLKIGDVWCLQNLTYFELVKNCGIMDGTI